MDVADLGMVTVASAEEMQSDVPLPDENVLIIRRKPVGVRASSCLPAGSI